MTSLWTLQDAKARFSELVDKVLSDGPQHVSRRGSPAVVVISEIEFERIRNAKEPRQSLVQLMQSCPAPEIFDYIEEGRRTDNVGLNDAQSSIL